MAGQQCFNTRGWCAHLVTSQLRLVAQACGCHCLLYQSLLARITASGRPHAPLPARYRTCMHMPLPK